MEASYTTPMGPNPFYYYQPDPQSEQQRQQGHFPPQLPQSAIVPPQMVKSMAPFPVQGQQPYLAASHPAYQHLIPTPVASPQPIHHRPTILIEKQEPRLHALDTDCSPATPALSASGSSASSPPSSIGFLPTPVNGSTPAPEMHGVKQGCEVEVLSEILAGGDFQRSQSPPLTPSKFTRYRKMHGYAQGICGTRQYLFTMWECGMVESWHSLTFVSHSLCEPLT